MRAKMLLLALWAAVGLGAAALLGSPAPACAKAICPQAPVVGRQPYPNELALEFERAGKNLLGNRGPVVGKINKGYPDYVKVDPYVPCILMKAIGYTESGWKQFKAGWGQQGETVISDDCGYGIMQITSGMNGSGGFLTARVAGEPAYNLGTGAQELVRKWNNSPFIGQNDPAVVEEWYYATWAYNGWASVNDPTNPNLDADRPPYDGTQPRSEYPYQELVWGFAAHPPRYNGAPLWTAVPLTLPNRQQVALPAPVWIPRPSPWHTSCPPGQPVSTNTPPATATSTQTRTPTATATSTPTRTATPTATPTWTRRPTHPYPQPELYFPIAH